MWARAPSLLREELPCPQGSAQLKQGGQAFPGHPQRLPGTPLSPAQLHRQEALSPPWYSLITWGTYVGYTALATPQPAVYHMTHAHRGQQGWGTFLTQRPEDAGQDGGPASGWGRSRQSGQEQHAVTAFLTVRCRGCRCVSAPLLYLGGDTVLCLSIAMATSQALFPLFCLNSGSYFLVLQK